MKFLREKDDNYSTLCSLQARIFEKASENNLPSFFFIQTFMNSSDAEQLDNLLFLLSGSSSSEIYTNIAKKLPKIKKPTIYDSNVMHWIGFFYRATSYLLNISSKELFKNIPPRYLNSVYPLYHSLDLKQAIQIIFDDLEYEHLSPNERFMKLFKIAM